MALLKYSRGLDSQIFKCDYKPIIEYKTQHFTEILLFPQT